MGFHTRKLFLPPNFTVINRSSTCCPGQPVPLHTTRPIAPVNRVQLYKVTVYRYWPYYIE